MTPPVKITYPQPRYTEEARQARIQGVVILRGIVDVDGTVKNITVVKGLPMGLSESAVQTVETWVFEPSRLEGRPVPVHYVFTINFSLQ